MKTKTFHTILFVIVALVIFVLGANLYLNGSLGFDAEANRYESSAIRQTIWMLKYCTGLLLVGISAVIAVIATK